MSANGSGRNGTAGKVVGLLDGTDMGADVPPVMDCKPSAQEALVGGMNGKLKAGSAAEPPVREMYEGVSEPTPVSTWYAASGTPITDRLLDWPPDVFALTNVVLTRAEAFRYALSVKDWPPRILRVRPRRGAGSRPLGSGAGRRPPRGGQRRCRPASGERRRRGRDRRPGNAAGRPRGGQSHSRGAPDQATPRPVLQQLAAHGVQPHARERRLLPSRGRQPWFHIRQNKHHRWSLNKSQVEQYHLGGALHPHIRWWEAMDVPRKAIQFVEVAELVLTTLVCEDLAHNDDIAQLIRSVGPTLVMNMLLDGPQLNSRWTARYASVLADDPGSAVLTLTSYGMVERCRPVGRDASRVIALWKDPTWGVREIPLEPGAQGVLLTLCMDRATRYSADGRWPIDNSTSCYGVAVHQVHAASAGPGPGPGAQRSPSTAPTAPVLELDELTILTAWAEGVSEAAAYAPERIDRLLATAGPGATWRAELGLPEPSPRLADAVESLGRLVRAAPSSAGTSSFDRLLTAATQDHPGETTFDGVARRALLSMLEERRTRQPTQASDTR